MFLLQYRIGKDEHFAVLTALLVSVWQLVSTQEMRMWMNHSLISRILYNFKSQLNSEPSHRSKRGFSRKVSEIGKGLENTLC